MNLDEIVDAFSFFDSWEDKYRFVIDLGKEMPSLPDSVRNDEHLIRGCQSQVWLSSEYRPADNTMQLQIDSDAHIVRGLAAIVLACYHNKTPQDIVAHDMEALFDQLSLLEHLSPTRGNGLRSMVGSIKEQAQSHL